MFSQDERICRGIQGQENESATGGGRKITIAEITDGTCTADGTGTHYAISNGSSALYATQTLDSPQTIANGATFTLAAFDIGIPDPA